MTRSWRTTRPRCRWKPRCRTRWARRAIFARASQRFSRSDRPDSATAEAARHALRVGARTGSFMRVQILGGGPAGLTLAILLKHHDPAHQVRVVERGPRGATWGFGVVFSDRALDFLRADAPELHDLLTPLMQSWRDLTIVQRDVHVPIAGNGFAAIGRLELLTTLHGEAERLGV